MYKLFLLILVSLSPIPSLASEELCDEKNISANVKAEIQHYAELGMSATGDELSAALWRLGKENPDYGSAMWKVLSPGQKKLIYLSKIDSFLRSPESNSLTPKQARFIEDSRLVVAKVFEQNWGENSDKYLIFSMRAVEVLGGNLAAKIYGAGALWPRVPASFSVSQDGT